MTLKLHPLDCMALMAEVDPGI